MRRWVIGRTFVIVGGDLGTIRRSVKARMCTSDWQLDVEWGDLLTARSMEWISPTEGESCLSFSSRTSFILGLMENERGTEGVSKL